MNNQEKVANIEEALKRAKVFIEYARFELKDGKASIGSQFPHKEDADIEIARIDFALSQILELINKPELNEEEVIELIHKSDHPHYKDCVDCKNAKFFAEKICSHFSKPVIKYPEKKVLIPSTDMEAMEINTRRKGYNQAISDMRKLNGGGE